MCLIGGPSIPSIQVWMQVVETLSYCTLVQFHLPSKYVLGTFPCTYPTLVSPCRPSTRSLFWQFIHYTKASIYLYQIIVVRLKLRVIVDLWDFLLLLSVDIALDIIRVVFLFQIVVFLIICIMLDALIHMTSCFGISRL